MIAKKYYTTGALSILSSLIFSILQFVSAVNAEPAGAYRPAELCGYSYNDQADFVVWGCSAELDLEVAILENAVELTYANDHEFSIQSLSGELSSIDSSTFQSVPFISALQRCFAAPSCSVPSELETLATQSVHPAEVRFFETNLSRRPFSPADQNETAFLIQTGTELYVFYNARTVTDSVSSVNVLTFERID